MVGVVVCVFRYISYGCQRCHPAESTNHLFFAVFFFAANIWGTNKLIDWIVKHNLNAIVYLWYFTPLIPLDIILKLNVLVIKIIIFGFSHCLSSSINHSLSLGRIFIIHIAFFAGLSGEVCAVILIFSKQSIKHFVRWCISVRTTTHYKVTKILLFFKYWTSLLDATSPSGDST